MNHLRQAWVRPYLRGFAIVVASYRGFTYRFAITTALFFLLGAINAAVPYLLARANDALTHQLDTSYRAMLLVLGFGIVWTISQVFSWLKGAASAAALTRSDAAIYLAMLQHVIRLPLADQQRLSKSTIIQDIRRVRDSFSGISMSIFWTILPILFELFIAFLVVAKLISAKFAIIFIIMISILFIVSYIIAEKSGVIHKSIYASENKLFAHLSERLDALFNIKINRTYDHETQLGLAHAKENVTVITSTNIKAATLMSIQALAVGMVLTICSTYVAIEIRGGSISSSSFLVVIGYIMQITSPFSMLTSSLINLKKDFISLERGLHYLDMPPEPDKEIFFQGPRISNQQPAFEIENLALPGVYGKKISWIVPSSGTHVISGHSGIGKTTLLTMMLGMRGFESGSIKFQGEPVAKFGATGIFDELAFVPQHPFIFSGTLRENICYGASSNVSEVELENLVEQLDLSNILGQTGHSIITLDTDLGIMGSELSGGERQRIVIARALARGKKILVLDEPTSSIDACLEDRIIDFLESRSVLLIIVTHRKAIIDRADSVLDIGEFS
ncbi:ATP-binding cassette domain-containing protein [Burkholderia perseverans]|uniref:ATP-binding cassette domain-containing protein n=1 Tax=Burkholderia perseverans TaxID=2615214 RepID=UPI001FED5D36|nr:ABC transporter ATP-binding protein [Burkholderia perseverans]